MARLPQPGSDQGTWGDVLNDYLSQSLDASGSLKAGSVGAAQVPDGALPQAKVANLTTDLSTLGGSIDSLTTTTQGISDDVSDLQAAQTTLSDDISSVETALSSKADLVGGLVPLTQLPNGVKTRAVPVANQAAMLALTTTDVQPGDIAIRADGAGSFILTAPDPTALGNWSVLRAPLEGDLTAIVQLGSVSGTLDLSSYNRALTVHATLSGSITTVSLPTPAGLSYTITTILTQDATGGRTLATPVGTKRDSQLDPVLSTGAGLTDMLHWFCDGVSWWVIMGSRSA